MSVKNRAKPDKNIQTVNEKLRILCLHGYRQNGDSFKSKLGSFRKQVQKYAEFVFITAPHRIRPIAVSGKNSLHNDHSIDDINDLSTDSESADTERSWWFNKDDQTFRGTNKNGPAYGFDESLHLVEEAWQTLGPFHGLLGFSQGACFAGLICNLSMRGMTVVKPQFAILGSSFRSGSLAHLNYYEETILMPSLHIMGISDTIIPVSMSESLAACFEEPKIVKHPGGHFFPATTHQKQIYIDFFRNRLVEHLEKKELERAEAITIDSMGGVGNPSTSTATTGTSDDSD